jgi:hypothetical protein
LTIAQDFSLAVARDFSLAVARDFYLTVAQDLKSCATAAEAKQKTARFP